MIDGSFPSALHLLLMRLSTFVCTEFTPPQKPRSDVMGSDSGVRAAPPIRRRPSPSAAALARASECSDSCVCSHWRAARVLWPSSSSASSSLASSVFFHSSMRAAAASTDLDNSGYPRCFTRRGRCWAK